jgi:hypothetical protein
MPFQVLPPIKLEVVMFKKTPRRGTRKALLMMALVLVVGLAVFPAGIQAKQYQNAWQAQAEARARAWQRTQENLQRARAETQQRMRDAWQRNQEAWQRRQDAFWREFRQNQAALQRMEENRAKAYSTRDRVYRPGERHWSDPTEAQKHMDLGEGAAQYGRFWLDYWSADKQLRKEAAERQRQAAAQRARDDAALMGGPNYRPQPRTRVIDRDAGPRDRDVPQKLNPEAAAVIRDIERQLTNAQKSTGRETGGRSSDQSSPSRRESPQHESKSWQDDVREKMDRRP